MVTKDPGNTPYTRTLWLAAKTLGSAERLAAVLAVEHAQLLRWMSGAAFPPHEIFLKALDIVASGSAQGLADRAQAKADRAQAEADRSQAKADRDQASADRAQASADRQQKRARQSRDDAGKPADFRHALPDHSEPASNDSEESGKSTGSDQT